jgi:glycosyltransferase involved in cell wall biosynthesis
MSPRVAIVTSGSLLRPNGGALRVLYQARGLWECGFRDFTVFSREPDPRWPFAQGRVRPRGPAEFIFDQPPGFDLYHAHQNAGLFFEGRVWADLHGWAPVESALGWRARPFAPRAAALYLLSVWAVRRLARRCERFICASESIADNVRKNLKNAPPLEVVRNAVDLAEYPVSVCERPAVGVIGGFTSRWGVPAFAMALQVAELCPEIPFRFVGRISPAQQEDARRLSNVHALGEVDEAGFKAFFQTVSIALMPYDKSCRGGGARLKLLQAAASGLAVISTPVGVEGFDGGKDVLIGRTTAELAGVIRGQLLDAGARRRQGLALRRRAEEAHDYRKEGERLAGLYRRELK